MTELTRLLFTWGAFETVVSVVRPAGVDGGKVKATGHLLARQFEPEQLVHYRCNLAHLQQDVSKRPDLKVRDADFVPDADYSPVGVGIRAVYKLRNQLSHGALRFMPPGDWGGNPQVDQHIVRLSTRLVLMTIQMLLIVHLSTTNVLISYPDDSLDGEEVDQEASNVLRMLHLA